MNIATLPQYELLQQKNLEDISSMGYLLRHKKSGARVLVLENDDSNKVFNIAFRTTPKDSTGVPHIMEHSVLCGSRKFPSKDPFVELVKGSLNTFLNAMTYPDKTMYPVASTNAKDFNNLMHVYLDAVFYPNIYQREEIFRQEGWHYELESPEGEISYNGVVYNEMKGAFSSPEDVIEREIMNTLFPDTTYGVESGGDPVHIPDLTYEQFLEFHQTYYHPSNSYIYLYGNLDMEERLLFLDQEYLQHFDQKAVNSEIALQQPFDQVREFARTYPITEEDPLTDNTYLTFNAVIGNCLDVELSNAFAVLDYALISAPGARLKQALLDEEIGQDIISSYDSGIQQPVFSIMAKNANKEQKDRFVSVIRNTLQVIVEEGIDRKALMAGINTMEFRFREADYGSYPKGLIYGIDLFDSWLYDENHAFDYLEQIPVYTRLRELVDTGYFEQLIRTWLLDNPHASILVVEPERGKTEKEEQRVADLLSKYKASLSEKEILELVEKTRQLKKYQDTPSTQEELAAIPVLERGDIDRQAAPFFNQEYTLEGTKVLLHDLNTHGIAYIDLLFDASDLTKEELARMGLLKALLGLVDTQHYSYADLNNEINANTGGINVGISVYPTRSMDGSIQAYMGCKVRALYDKTAYALRMLEEILYTSSFENDRRLQEILMQTQSRLSMSLNSAGHSTAVTRMMSYFSEMSAFNDQIGGIAFYRMIQDLTEHFEDRKDQLRKDCQALCAKLFAGDRKKLLSITMEGKHFPEQEALLRDFLKCLSQKPCYSNPTAGKGDTPKQDAMSDSQDLNSSFGTPLRTHLTCNQKNEGFYTPGQVQYVARGGNFREKGFAYTGALRILKVIMGYEYLWLNVRVKGGAYGCMSNYGRSGDTYFVSYRDPHLKETNEIYNGIPDFLKSFAVSERDMTKYIIGTVSDLDVPRTPATEGARSLNAYLTGLTLEQIQKERDEVLDADPDSIRALAPLVASVLEQQYLCVIGNEKKVRTEKDLFTNIASLV